MTTATTTNTPRAQQNSNSGAKGKTNTPVQRSVCIYRRKDGTTILRLTINGKPTSYTIYATPTGYRLEYHDIKKEELKVYRVTVGVSSGLPIHCDCPDALYRNRECKHQSAIRVVLDAAAKE